VVIWLLVEEGLLGCRGVRGDVFVYPEKIDARALGELS
jgi:hypothetical protein